MKKVIVFLLILTLTLTGLTAWGNRETIVISSSLEQFRGDELQKQLSERFPGKNIIVSYMPTGKAAAKVLTEGENTEIDILVGLETGYLNKIREVLAEIPDSSEIPYLPAFTLEQNHNQWVTWEKQAGAIVVNTQVLDKYGLPAPETYEDLLDPMYQDLVAMPDPKSSGTGYFFLKSWVNAWGEEKALSYVDALYKNLKSFTESGSGPIKMLKQGEVGIGLALTFQAVDEQNQGQPLEIIFPELGSPYSLTGTALIKGREKDPEIMEIFQFIIHDFLQYDKEYFSPETIYENQINRIPNYPADIPYADMDGIQDHFEKERLLKLWKY